MIIDLSKDITVQCPYRDDAEDEYLVSVSVDSVKRNIINVPRFVELISNFEGETISGEDLCYELYKAITHGTYATTKVQVDVHATNAENVGFHVQCGKV